MSDTADRLRTLRGARHGYEDCTSGELVLLDTAADELSAAQSRIVELEESVQVLWEALVAHIILTRPIEKSGRALAATEHLTRE